MHDTLEEQAVPALEALLPPVLEPSILHHVASQNKKFILERDKERAAVQRAMLYATGPLCSPHDKFEQSADINPSYLKI